MANENASQSRVAIRPTASGGNIFITAVSETDACTLGIYAYNKLMIGDNIVPSLVSQSYSYKAWYRVWSDGFIEQGGRVTSISLGRGSTQTITFPYAFATAVSNISITNQTSGGNYTTACLKSGFSLTSFTAMAWGDSESDRVTGIFWQACGY